MSEAGSISREDIESLVRRAVTTARPMLADPADEQAQRVVMCDIGRRMYEQGYVAANDGNLSVRLPGDRFLCTPTGVSKGYMTPEMLCVIDAEGNQISGDLRITSEIKIHLAVMNACPHVHAVCHAHPVHASAFAITGTQIPGAILPEAEILLGPVPVLEFIMNGTWEIAEAVAGYAKQRHNTVILGNHGVVGWDRTLEQAYYHIETIDACCKTLLLAKQLGPYRELPADVVDLILGFKKKCGIDDPRFAEDEIAKPTELPAPPALTEGHNNEDLIRSITAMLAEKLA
jgi:L-fuculose-phosphate aldolase